MNTRRLISRYTRTLARRWPRVNLRWSVADREPMVFAVVLGTIVGGFGLSLDAVFEYKEDRLRAIRDLLQVAGAHGGARDGLEASHVGPALEFLRSRHGRARPR